MAKHLNEEILVNIRELIAKITPYEVGTDEFKSKEKCILTMLKKSDTMYFLNRKDIKCAVWSMADKFEYHGFPKHGEYLKQTHDKYVDKNLSESDLTPRLNIVKCLLCLSKRPTTNFWESPEDFDFIYDSEATKEVIDWAAYLNEGIERWSPVNDDSFQDFASEDEADSILEESKHKQCVSSAPTITESRISHEYDVKESLSELADTVQSGWSSGEVTSLKPQSEWFDANVGIFWENHLQSLVHDLIEIEPVTVISEYRVMREILWQMWGPHSSTVFELKIDKLVPKPRVTISSVCAVMFESFMHEFVPYISTLDEFRQFSLSLVAPNTPETYKGFDAAVQKLMRPVYKQLLDIEEEIKAQKSTFTLLKLAENLGNIFAPVFILKRIKNEVISNDEHQTPLQRSLTLLTSLSKGFQFSLNKVEQDIRLTLYMESLYYYLSLVDAWLTKNTLFDYTEEFVILNKNKATDQSSQDPNMNFILQKDVEEYCKDDGVIRIVFHDVLQIGRNIHFLRLLGKYGVFAKKSESIHEEFVRRTLEELSILSDDKNTAAEVPPVDINLVDSGSFFYIKNTGDWIDYVDVTDGFLAKAFDDIHIEISEEEQKETSLFEKISKSTVSLFPLQELLEKIFGQILKDRFTISGLMVKNVLIEKYGLDKQLEFLYHIFLFWDDLISSFHTKVFEKMNMENSSWGNSVWLTSHLQDVIMDLYPNFYEGCIVQVKEFWKQCRCSLDACSLMSVEYDIKWPLDIIITADHMLLYKEVFQFILKLKWSLYTLSHLYFTDLEPRNKKNARLVSELAIQRLKYLRFNLLNTLNTIQHYIFGFVFNKCRIEFELGFEKSNDLQSLITSHENFIKSIHRSVAEIRDKTHDEQGFNSLLKCVKMLKVIWNRLDYATTDHLENCFTVYKLSSTVVDSIVSPVFIYDY